MDRAVSNDVRMRLQLDVWRGLTYEVQIKTSIVES